MNPSWCLSDAECNFNKALIMELVERVQKLERVIIQLYGQDMLDVINTWPIEREVKNGTRK
jgi:hypothetical protein